jgi:beta-ribofuranosylaminobenzene 5'-phosphate synthase
MKNGLSIQAGSRIHVGLLNESAYMGRIDGGMGFSLEEPSWAIRIVRGAGSITGLPVAEEFSDSITHLLQRWAADNSSHFDVDITRSVPAHAGLGSKTSLLMAVAKGISVLDGLDLSSRELGSYVRRGSTSGVGVGVFEGGGVVWDMGHRFPQDKDTFAPTGYSSARPPYLFGRYELDWLDVVHFRFSDFGLHSAAEADAFRRECPIPEDETRDVLANYAFRVIPGIVEREETALQAGLAHIQETGFKRVEWRYQTELTLAFKDYWRAQRLPETLGLSSFGPTLYVLSRDAERVLQKVEEFGTTPLHICKTKVASHGPRMEIIG